MAQKNNAGMRSLVKKCNRAFDQMAFNEQYPDVYEGQLAARDARRMKELENQAKERLLPLELAACPEAQANRWRIDREMAALTEKQCLKRRAIEQDYLRAVEKNGQEAAGRERAQRLSGLDRELAGSPPSGTSPPTRRRSGRSTPGWTPSASALPGSARPRPPKSAPKWRKRTRSSGPSLATARRG